MATHCVPISVNVAGLCALLVAVTALPTAQDVAVRLRHDPPTPQSKPRPVPASSSSINSAPNAAVALQPVSLPAQQPPPQAAATLPSQSSSKVLAPGFNPSNADRFVNPAPSSPGNSENYAYSSTGNSVHSAPSNSVGSVNPAPNPFTNHFVLDTANLDLDSDGCIAGEAELDLFKYHVATALIGSPDSLLRAHSIVHRTDVNKDGRICWCDFISIYLHDKNQANENHHAAPFLVVLDKESGMFSRLDLDGDGKLQGAELQGLVNQFSSCIPEEQARLIVAAITGLGVKDGAISSEEFARFLGMKPEQLAANPTDAKPAAEAAPSSGSQGAAPKSGIPGVVLASTTPPAPPSPVAGEDEKTSPDGL